jgi:hypothetical protein
LLIKNPIGLAVLGIAVTIFIGPAIYKSQDSLSWVFVGIIITIIGVLWFIMRKRKEQKAIAAHLPLYREIVDALKKSGYEVDEFEHKSDRVRSSVRLNGNNLGEIFLVVPGGRYAQFRRIEDMTEKEFQHNYSKKFKKSPDIAASFWPEESGIGAFIEESAENCSEKGEWLSKLADSYQEKVPKN